ncbi:ABC transporter permease [Propionispora hippei]|uniref:NitT/TauT family transport system permease protein n=1 Tax=Propionispora hippei DSM 15287 TaxID=1123003 RepID=A0A1M6ILT9_9FIRM|nr:ABC transporter permease subunit [Propionispora hippei]SHJ35333.1 NitT/TauT family transport system permease protein [Propionispora hippei DSM 15287]
MAIFSSHIPTRRFGLLDLAVIIFVFSLLYSLVRLSSGMAVPFSPETQLDLSSNPADLPYYAGRSLLRMFLAYGASLIFTLLYGSLAAKNRLAEKVLIPLLDILQSIPVLGFLSVTITMFIGMFPGSLLGVELASIFAIFTGQCWNMTFSFYHSLTTLPKDLKEAATMLRLNPWQRFIRLEVPFSMIGLVWNSMMSFGGGWFFLAASETITVLNSSIQLPGIGSFMAAAIANGDMTALVYAMVTMVLMIVAVDQLFWRPIVVWSQKFKMERTAAKEVPSSFVYDLLQRAIFITWLRKYLLTPLCSAVYSYGSRFVAFGGHTVRQAERFKLFSLLRSAFTYALALGAIYYVVREAYDGYQMLATLGTKELGNLFVFGFYTLGRIIVATLFGLIWTVPVGVWIGTNPRLTKLFQPLVQIAASFPANMLYPFIAVFYLQHEVNFEFGSIALMALGTQWYILFNVIAGATTIPNDLKEAAVLFKLSGRQRWQKLILPAIFPSLITGCITATGGAWNASIISELLTWKENQLVATGIGGYISQATATGDWPSIIGGIVVMCVFVILMNRLLWRRLFQLSETKYHLN